MKNKILRIRKYNSSGNPTTTEANAKCDLTYALVRCYSSSILLQGYNSIAEQLIGMGENIKKL